MSERISFALIFSIAIKVVFCLVVFIAAGLTQIPLLKFETGQSMNFAYTPLYLLVFILSISFKNNYACAATLLYLVLGLVGLPIFAFGGGLHYVFLPSFGYLIALLILSVSAFYWRYHYQPAQNDYKKTKNFKPVLSIFCAHFFGLIFLLLTGHFSLTNFLAVNLCQFIYDLIFAFIVVFVL